LAQPGLRRVELQEIIGAERFSGGAARCHEKTEDRPMQPGLRMLAALALSLAPPSAQADNLEKARDLMEQNRFEAAHDALWPLARAGNADAEELIGILHALGLGVEQDYARAFDWYLRSAMKGHPGAQSGVGWYYEVGLGMPAPDLVRAYLWYVLSAIGGDPDAAISQQEVIKKMTAEQIEHGNRLVEDYKAWMYPFR
jgi:TPR repeat protein